MRATDLLDQLPRWPHTPEPIVAAVAALQASDESDDLLYVGDGPYLRLRVQARHDARAIVRDGMRDVLEWLEAAGVKVYV